MTGVRSSWPRRLVTPRPYEVSWLALALAIHPADTHTLAIRLNLDRRTINRYRTWGLTALQADTWATRAGLHPLEIWPHWDLDADTHTDHMPETAA